MKFVVVNDDGINGVGYRVLADILTSYGEVVAIVPSNHCSAKSHGVTLKHEFSLIKYQNDKYELYTVDGLPADCSRFAKYLVPDCDIIFSGINDGVNLGMDTLYSGTVAASKEAALLGYRSVALSCPLNSEEIVDDVRYFIEQLLFNNLYHDEKVINVNFPQKVLHKEIKTTVLGGYLHDDGVIKLANGKYTYDNKTNFVGVEGTDVHAFNNGYVSVTPLILDTTKK